MRRCLLQEAVPLCSTAQCDIGGRYQRSLCSASSLCSVLRTEHSDLMQVPTGQMHEETLLYLVCAQMSLFSKAELGEGNNKHCLLDASLESALIMPRSADVGPHCLEARP